MVKYDNNTLKILKQIKYSKYAQHFLWMIRLSVRVINLKDVIILKDFLHNWKYKYQNYVNKSA